MRSLMSLATACFILGGIFWGSSLIRPDEPLYVQTALEMRARNDWIVPYYEGKPSFIKPPLGYWLQLAGMRVFGEKIWAGRLPIWILGLLSVWLVYKIGEGMYSSEVGLVAGSLFLCNVFFFSYAQSAMTDVPFMFFVILSLYLFLRGEKGDWLWLGLFGAAVGFSTLTKGPASALLCAGVAAIYAWAQKESICLKAGHAVWVALAAAVCGVIWPLALVWRGYGGAWFHQFILGENFGKFAGPVMPFKILIIGLFGGIVPWTFLFIDSLIRSGWNFRKDNRRVFFMGWILFVFIFFLLPDRKLPHYMLPAIPACCLLMAASEEYSAAALWGTRVLLGVIGILWILGSRLAPTVVVQFVILAGGISAIVSALALKAPGRLAFCAILFGVLLSTIPIGLPAVECPGQQAAVARLFSYGRVGVFCPTDRDPRGFELSPRFSSFENTAAADEFLQNGGVLIVSRKEEKFLGPTPVAVVEQWRVWKGGLGLGKVIRAAWSGDSSRLQEEMLAVKMRSP